MFVCLSLWCLGLNVDLILSVPEFTDLLSILKGSEKWNSVGESASRQRDIILTQFLPLVIPKVQGPRTFLIVPRIIKCLFQQ